MTKQGEDLYHYNKQNNRKKSNKLYTVYFFFAFYKALQIIFKLRETSN